jgi:hypothetical protein
MPAARLCAGKAGASKAGANQAPAQAKLQNIEVIPSLMGLLFHRGRYAYGYRCLGSP